MSAATSTSSVGPNEVRAETVILDGRRHVRVDTLSRGLRADIVVCVPERARSLDELVVLKSFHPAAAAAAWTPLVAELELARALRCEQALRPLMVGLEPGRCSLVHEYLEGATLGTCLDWAAARRIRWPNAALGRILCALLAVVEHADQVAPCSVSRALVYGPIAAEDVFLTHDGQVKLLGFKSAFRQPVAARATAVDALLEQQLTPELQVVLRRLPPAAEARSGAASESSLQLFRRWRSDELRSDGRAELSRLMLDVEPRARARQALRLVAAFSQLRGRTLKFRHAADLEDSPAQSGYRTIGVQETQSGFGSGTRQKPGLQPIRSGQ